MRDLRVIHPTGKLQEPPSLALCLRQPAKTDIRLDLANDLVVKFYKKTVMKCFVRGTTTQDLLKKFPSTFWHDSRLQFQFKDENVVSFKSARQHRRSTALSHCFPYQSGGPAEGRDILIVAPAGVRSLQLQRSERNVAAATRRQTFFFLAAAAAIATSLKKE